MMNGHLYSVPCKSEEERLSWSKIAVEKCLSTVPVICCLSAYIFLREVISVKTKGAHTLISIKKRSNFEMSHFSPKWYKAKKKLLKWNRIFKEIFYQKINKWKIDLCLKYLHGVDFTYFCSTKDLLSFFSALLTCMCIYENDWWHVSQMLFAPKVLWKNVYNGKNNRWSDWWMMMVSAQGVNEVISINQNHSFIFILSEKENKRLLEENKMYKLLS